MASDPFQFTPLGRDTVRRLTGGDADEGVLVSGSAAQVKRVVRVLRSFLHQRERDEQLVDLLVQDLEPRVMGAEHVKQLHLQAEARQEFMRDVPLLSSREVGELLGSAAKNQSARASRLKRDGKLFAVTHRGAGFFPAFQIVDGEVHPAIKTILRAFAGATQWTIGLWFHAPSGWLDGERPLDLLRREPARVIKAARKTTEPLVG